MKRLPKVLTSFLLSTVLLSSAWADEAYLPNPATAQMDQAPLVEIRNAKRVFPGILSGGQPTDDQLAKAKSSGFKTIINLRPVSETQGESEAITVRGLGMNYINIPVAGAGGITSENSQVLIDVLADTDQYPVMVHCASGNRVGALFALDAALRGKLPVEDAIVIGKQAGMTGLESVARNRIGLIGEAQSKCQSTHSELSVAASSEC